MTYLFDNEDLQIILEKYLNDMGDDRKIVVSVTEQGVVAKTVNDKPNDDSFRKF